MNYRHAFHAGNHADVFKHMALVFCLDALRRKETPFAVLDTHAGPGLYDLTSDEARRSPEWKDGIGRLWGWKDAPGAIGAYLEAMLRDAAPAPSRIYRGSPILALQALREQDRLVLCEPHEDDFIALKQNLAGSPRRVECHRRDGYEALGALTPFPEKRGLVLIDPPYEQPDEIQQAIAALKKARRRFRQGVYLWWRPLKGGSALDQADAELSGEDALEMLRADFWVDTPAPTGKLVGSSLLVINPPFGLEAALREALPALAKQLAIGKSGWRVSSL